MYYPSLAENENEDIPKIHLNADKTPWDPSTEEFSEYELCISDYWCQIILSVTAARGQVFAIRDISYSLVNDAVDVMGEYNLATELSSQIQISNVLIIMVRKLSVEPIVK